MINQAKSANRITKVNSLIKRQLGPILQKFLEDQQGLVTVSKVETSGDLRWAKVWLSIFGGNDEKILKTINQSIYFIQGKLNKHFKTKIIPRLQFFLDTNPRYAEHIEELIKKIHEGK